MQFKSMLKKNGIQMIRNLKWSLVEIIIPIVCCLILIILRTQVTLVTPVNTQPISLMTQSSLKQINLIPQNLLLQSMKNCTNTRRGGRIALIPQNDITLQLEQYFNKLNYTSFYLNSNTDLNNYILAPDYNIPFTNGTIKQICFAVVFDTFQSPSYSYSLRFNVTIISKDHQDTTAPPTIPFTVDSPTTFQQIISNGVLTLQSLIETLIIQKETNTTSQIQIAKMDAPSTPIGDYNANLGKPMLFVFVLCVIVVVFKIVSFIVEEKETQNLQNMENMGLSKNIYLISHILFYILIQIAIGILVSIILKFGVIKRTDFFLIFLVYFIFQLVFISIGFLISSCFYKTKKALLTTAGIVFFLFVMWIVSSNIITLGPSAYNVLALSPFVGVSFVLGNFLSYESINQNFTFTDVNLVLNNFAVSTFFIISVCQIILFFLLGFYLFYVVPGINTKSKHPLFLFGINWKENSEAEQNPEEIESQEFFNNQNLENFEPITNELLMQKSINQTLTIEGLSKEFKNGKLAVDNLSTEMFKDQIFALIGHNGAGKTTTISMISGLVSPSKGLISIKGLNSVKEREQIKEFMGVCPQVNPIFDYLTVKEHLELYWNLKGGQGDLEQEIDEILNDIDLFHKKNFSAFNLSGGQKRKLCIAIAFIGNSQVILLDEPTSGMDTYARRYLWEMIKKYKQNKIIILTTHNMDEAEYLGDRIGIMSNGKMVTCGSSLFLKKKFGVGYELTLVKIENSPVPREIIENAVLQIISTAQLISDVGIEMKFRLPLDQSSKFEVFFSYLEQNLQQFGIQSFGICLTTLEEVFLRVGQISNPQYFDEKHIDDNFNQTQQQQPIEKSEGLQLFNMQLQSLLWKKIIIFRRDIGSLICEIFLPIVVVIIGLALTKISIIQNSPSLQITPNYFSSFNFTSNTFQNQQNVFAQIIPNNYTVNIQNLDFNSFSNYIFNTSSISQYYDYFVTNYTQVLNNYTIFVNSTSPYSPYVAMNTLNNAILRQRLNSTTPSINMNLFPLIASIGIQNLQNTVEGFFTVILIGLAFSFIPSSIIQFIIKERENNAKHQQIISGAGKFSYWFSNFLLDFAKYFITMIVIFVLFYAFEIDFFTKGDAGSMSFLLLLFFGISMILFTYCISFIFTNPGKGQLFIFFFSFSSSMILVILSFALRIINSDTRNASVKYIEYFLRLDIFFSYGFGILALANVNLYKILLNWTEIPVSFDLRIALTELIYLVTMPILFLIIIIVIENFHLFSFFRKSNNQIYTQMIENDTIDEDVLLEEQTIYSGLKNYIIKVDKLVKTFSLSGTSDSFGKSISKKIAIDKISFGVEKGTVFGLLGTNGAGKTTTFKILTGDETPTNGDAFIMNRRIPDEINQVRHMIGYCPQFDALISNLTAREHLELYANLKGIKKEQQEKEIEDSLLNLGLMEFANIRSGTFSGGNKRKLSVAIATIGKPSLIFLDEPSSGMDPEARKFMWSVINKLKHSENETTVVLTTHSMEEADALSNKLAIMVEGKIKAIGPVQKLKTKFGKGQELECKVEILADQYLQILKQNVEKVFQQNLEIVNGNQIGELLDYFGCTNLRNEFTKDGIAKAFFQQLDSTGHLDGKTLIQWIDIQQKLIALRIILETNFQAIEIQSFNSFASFRINENHKLSTIFGFIEKNKEQLRIENYSVKQISLEQIFINFAKNSPHNDQQIIYYNDFFIQ